MLMIAELPATFKTHHYAPFSLQNRIFNYKRRTQCSNLTDVSQEANIGIRHFGLYKAFAKFW